MNKMIENSQNTDWERCCNDCVKGCLSKLNGEEKEEYDKRMGNEGGGSGNSNSSQDGGHQRTGFSFLDF